MPFHCGVTLVHSTKITTVAFYLPQFHPVAINDLNWGEGFSEWINVAKARPLFPGHFQPRLPGKLGFYDLRCPEVLEDQAELARLSGIDCFCFYYYRFGAQRLLDRPVEDFLRNRRADISFLYCWANESWTKAWDGRSDEVLLAQDYGETLLPGLVEDLIRASADPRHLRIGGRPVFMVYQVLDIPDAKSFIGRLRDAVAARTGEALMVGAVFPPRDRFIAPDWLDFLVQFPPHRIPRTAYSRTLLAPAHVEARLPERGDYFEPYQAVIQASLDPGQMVPRMMLGVVPDWDNSPRRRHAAHILVGNTPALFREWTSRASLLTLQRQAAGEIPASLLFVNAWNEWGEGAMLEPSLEKGSAFLDAFRDGLFDGRAQFLRHQRT